MSVALAKVESWEDHVEAWHHWTRQEAVAANVAAWEKGAIAASLKNHYGDGAIEKFAKEVKAHRSTVFRFRQVYEAFPEKSRRRENLTYWHHLEALQAPDPAIVLEQAADGQWSVRQLRAEIKKLSPEPAGPAAACDTAGGACGPLTADDKIFHIAAMVDSFYSVKDYEIAPLVSIGSKRSLKQLSRKIREAVKWLESLDNAIRERTR